LVKFWRAMVIGLALLELEIVEQRLGVVLEMP